MGTDLIVLYSGQPGVTDTVLNTPNANIKLKITAATVTNDTTTEKYITVHNVPASGSAGDDNIIINQKVVGSKETVPLWELVNQTIPASGFLSAIAEAADQLTVHISAVSFY